MNIDKFVQDGQDPKVVEKLFGKIVDMMTHGESISYMALQKKPAVTLLPDSITISNKRIFLCEFTKLGLATNFEIFSWTDIKDIAFKEEIFGSKVTVIPFTGENLSIDYIPKVQARKLYQLIKEALEETKNESKPVRTDNNFSSKTELEKQKVEVNTPVSSFENKTAPVVNETHVTAAHTAVQENKMSFQPASSATPQQATTAPKSEEEDEITQKLKKLKTLYDRQLITQSEYESKKAEILSQL